MMHETKSVHQYICQLEDDLRFLEELRVRYASQGDPKLESIEKDIWWKEHKLRNIRELYNWIADTNAQELCSKS